MLTSPAGGCVGDAGMERGETSLSPAAAASLLQWWRDAGVDVMIDEAPRVCPSGDPASGVMIVADMPSGEDCASGALISGEAGRLFDAMLKAIGRDRESVYLAALSCLRSPDGRLATPVARHCADLARHHVGLVQPRALLLLGDAVSKALLGLPMAQARGRWHEISVYGGTVRAMVTRPPVYLLGQSAQKALAWADLQMLLDEVK